VVLMDIRMPDTDGLAARGEGAHTDHVRDHEYVFEALRAGRADSWARASNPTSCSTRSGWSPGATRCCPPATKTLIGRFLQQPDRHSVTKPEQLDALTNREREVLSHVGAGMSNDAIAEHLVLSPSTAKTHVNRVMAKLGARDRAQLVVIAYETGLVRPNGYA
jgi:DNA-binding NarL/FixJ family response regulator